MRNIHFIIVIVLFCFCSCSAQIKTINKINETGYLSDCDSNFINAIHAIENDTFPNFEGGYHSFLTKCENKTHDNCYNKKYVFVNEFDSSLFVLENWPEDGIDTIFSRQELENYKDQEFKIGTACYPNYSFVSKDTADKWLLPDSNSPECLTWIYSFSKPLISSDKKFMLIQMTGRYGRLCGGFMSFIIERGTTGWLMNRIIFGAIF